MLVGDVTSSELCIYSHTNNRNNYPVNNYFFNNTNDGDPFELNYFIVMKMYN